MGVVLLAVLGYCFLASAVLVLIHRNRVPLLTARIVPGEISAGEEASVTLIPHPGAGVKPGKGRFFRLPGILLRYRVRLCTRDGRRISRFFDPAPPGASPGKAGNSPAPALPPAGRGAYYSDYDEFCVIDALGLFRAAFRLPQEKSPRLLAAPRTAAEPPAVEVRSGGEERPRESRLRRTDNLIDHRPYIPGDDPRRINWKLYGHAGDLFVREGEPEPPPHSKLVILVDTQVDPGLYTAESGRLGVDMLCENALALALEYAGRGMDMRVGYSGGGISGGTGAELASALAYPAALFPGPAGPSKTALPGEPPPDLPIPGESRGILVLALPRTPGNPSALDRFIQNRGAFRELDILFLYTGEEPATAAADCAARYNQRNGVHARSSNSQFTYGESEGTP
jgi:uncharacterized protein (DUF58 family)